MHGTIAVTDYGWYEYLLHREIQEVNFWTPSARRAFHAPEFSPFLFKLKAPHNAICGCGSLAEMRERIGAIRRRIHYVQEGPLANIGCILLIQPTFFERDAWVPQPRDWHPRTVTNKGYDLSTGEGRRIWQACLERAAGQSAISSTSPSVHESISRYGAPYPFAPRLGQGTFRIAVTEAYQRACAVTAEHSLPALEAAHIRSFAQEGPHEIRNGLLLRADLHRLFDQGYLTVAPDHRLEVSRRLREDYHNGRSYYPLHGQVLRLPASVEERPALEFIQWHNEHVFLG